MCIMFVSTTLHHIDYILMFSCVLVWRSIYLCVIKKMSNCIFCHLSLYFSLSLFTQGSACVVDCFSLILPLDAFFPQRFIDLLFQVCLCVLKKRYNLISFFVFMWIRRQRSFFYVCCYVCDYVSAFTSLFVYKFIC